MCKIFNDSSALAEEHVREEFRQWLQKQHPDWARSTVDMYYSDAYYLYNNNIGITLVDALNANDSDKMVYNAIKKHFTPQRIKTTPDNSAKGYLRSFKLLKEFLEERFPKFLSEASIAARPTEDKPKTNNNENHIYKKEPKDEPVSETLIKKPSSESSYEIAQRVKKIILKINEIYKINRKKPIFNESIKLWGYIEKPCVSRDDFKIFSETLYNLFDKTRYKNSKYSRNNGEPYYISMLPKDFTQDNPTTTHFIFIVNTLRHYYVHEETDKIADVYEELLGHRFGPDSSEDFETLQKKVLSLFETSMKILLDMVKDE